MRSVPAFSSNAANLRKEVPIDKQISPEKCYVDYGPSNFIVYRDDGTWQNTQGFGPLAEAFPQLANLPKCTIPTSATIPIHSSGDHPRLVGHVSRADQKTWQENKKAASEVLLSEAHRPLCCVRSLFYDGGIGLCKTSL
jgi:hypothetical protein